VETHAFGHVEEHGEDLVLVCSCGWRSEPRTTASGLGRDWDAHRFGDASP
jgi:hypothetical protein